ncbi:MAG: ribonuclease E inhibitor RraB [Planctomycetota bacterium]
MSVARSVPGGLVARVENTGASKISIELVDGEVVETLFAEVLVDGAWQRVYVWSLIFCGNSRWTTQDVAPGESAEFGVWITDPLATHRVGLEISVDGGDPVFAYSEPRGVEQRRAFLASGWDGLRATTARAARPFGHSLDSYFALVDGAPAEISIDAETSAEFERGDAHAPDRRYLVRAAFGDPRVERDPRARDPRAIARSIRRVERDGDCTFVGQITTDVFVELYFRADDELAARRAVRAHLDRPDLSLISHDDPDGKIERLLLVPTWRDRRCMANLDVVEQLEGLGDVGAKSRPIEHFAILRSDSDVDGFVAAARELGYEAKRWEDEDLAPESDERWMHVVRDDPATWDAVNAASIELTELAERFGGVYDGWETVIAR